MAFTLPPLQKMFSFENLPSWPELEDFFLFSDSNNGDSVAEAETLPGMEEIEDEPWLEGGGGDSVSLVAGNLLGTCTECNASGISSCADLSSGSGSVPRESNLSSFCSLISPTICFNSQFQPDSSISPLPATSTNTHATQNKEAQKQSRKEEEEEAKEEDKEAVMFIVESDGNALYDGYSWRKYREKSIKHRNYRRSYYKCGHDGCKVKKHVERSSEKPAEFHITYYGRHNHSPVTGFSIIGYNYMPFKFSYSNL